MPQLTSPDFVYIMAAAQFVGAFCLAAWMRVDAVRSLKQRPVAEVTPIANRGGETRFPESRAA